MKKNNMFLSLTQTNAHKHTHKHTITYRDQRYRPIVHSSFRQLPPAIQSLFGQKAGCAGYGLYAQFFQRATRWSPAPKTGVGRRQQWVKKTQARCASGGRRGRGGAHPAGSSGAPPHRSAPSDSPAKTWEYRGLGGEFDHDNIEIQEE